MPWTCQQVEEERLRLARTEEEYALHLAALEWSLADSIVIDSAEDIKSRLNWQERLTPFAHQVRNLFTFCRRLPVTLIADDVGLGKTISAGLILAELMARRRVARALVLCPRILAPQWVEELDSKFGITAKMAFGRAVIDEFRRQTPVVVTTYDSVRDRLKLLKPDSFGMVILDEAHKLRNLFGTKDPPRMAVDVREALAQRLFKYVLMLTATPIQNRLWDSYALLDCLAVAKGHKNPLGTPEEFQNNFIAPGTAGRGIVAGKAEQFRAILRQYLVRTRRSEAELPFPQREVRLDRVTPTAEEARLHRLVAARIASLPKLLQTSLAQALMSSPQALASQMENMVKTGKFTPQEAAEARQIADRTTLTAKLRGLLALADDLKRQRPAEWRMVVFTIRKETQQAIGKALSERGVTFGHIQGGEARRNHDTIERFRANPPGAHVIVSTDAGSEGINLQVANVVVNYDLPWNPMVVEQRIGRIQRLASTHMHVVVWNLVIAGTVEEHVVARLMQKLQLISHAIGDIEAILESVGWDGDGEESNSFESQIRELVVKALIGQDVARDTELKRRSIERAQQHLEQQREELDQTLGRLDSLHRAGPTLPTLTRMAPSVPAQDFVLRAKRAEGARVDRLSEGLFEAHAAGKPRELLAFNEAAAEIDGFGGVFMGNAPKLFMPGKQHFERLTQYWVDNAGHRIADHRSQSASHSEDLGRKWCAGIPGAQFRRVDLESASQAFQGTVVFTAKAGNAVDSYEKLITATCRPKGHLAFEIKGDPAGLVKSEILPSETLTSLKREVARAVESDKDVAEFCRFYEARLSEERVKTGNDERMLHKVDTDFRPVVFAEIGSMQGAIYEVAVVAVHFTFDGEHDHAVQLLAVPATGQILNEPVRERCVVSGRDLPTSCLGVSAVSGKRVLRDLLLQCEITGGSALREELLKSDVSGKWFRADQKVVSASRLVGHGSEFLVCAMTGDRILPSEAGTSQVSGRVVRKELLRRSEKPPGRVGARDEIVICASSGKRILVDEAGKSAVSGKACDRDLLVPSARSGRLALKDELVRCQQSGALLLPDEVGLCFLTRQTVDKQLLATSQFSGTTAMKHLLERCAKTGKLVLPQELEVCELTGQRVIPTELETCFISGRRALRDRLFRSDVSGHYLLPELAVRSSISGRVCASKEAVICHWLEEALPPAEVGVCRRTGLPFANKFLHEGEFSILRQLLDGTREGSNLSRRFHVEQSRPELVRWLKEQYPKALGNLKSVTSIASPKGGVRAICGELRSLFGLKVRYVGLLVRDRDQRQVLGRVTIGRRTPEGWIAEQELDAQTLVGPLT